MSRRIEVRTSTRSIPATTDPCHRDAGYYSTQHTVEVVIAGVVFSTDAESASNARHIAFLVGKLLEAYTFTTPDDLAAARSRVFALLSETDNADETIIDQIIMAVLQ